MDTTTLIAVIAAGLCLAGIAGTTFWLNKPTATDRALYELGFNDGADGREPEAFEHPRNSATYREGYREGSAGRNRRADAERLQARRNGPGRY